jgi:hypothetical protein
MKKSLYSFSSLIFCNFNTSSWFFLVFLNLVWTNEALNCFWMIFQPAFHSFWFMNEIFCLKFQLLVLCWVFESSSPVISIREDVFFVSVILTQILSSIIAIDTKIIWIPSHLSNFGIYELLSIYACLDLKHSIHVVLTRLNWVIIIHFNWEVLGWFTIFLCMNQKFVFSTYADPCLERKSSWLNEAGIKE